MGDRIRLAVRWRPWLRLAVLVLLCSLLLQFVLQVASANVAGLARSKAPGAAAQAHQSASFAAVRASLQSELNRYLNARRVPEHISAVSLTVTFRKQRPAINLAVGSTRYRGGRRISPHALWQIGSNTKAFTAVILLQLEAEHKLSIRDTVGKWLPRYPAWRQITIKQLLNMTSGIPNYTDVPAFLSRYATAPNRVFTTARLVSYAIGLPRQPGYYYSNTGYILAQMIIERATHDSYGDQLRRRIIIPLGLHDMFFSPANYSPAITARIPAGYYFAASQGPMAEQYGKDQSHYPMSWGQAAGGIVSSLQDMVKWDRALYTGRELPTKQQHELETLVSQKTGKPIKTTTLADPLGFGLGLEQATTTPEGTTWWYQGQTYGFTVIHVYLPRTGTLFAIGLNSGAVQQTRTLIHAIYHTLHQASLA